MKYSILFLIAFVVLSGCTKQSNPVTNFIYTHSDSALVGTMTGFIDLYDSTYLNYSNNIVSGHAGATISLDGTPFSTTSDSTGKWVLKNIPAGTYSITFSKPGYAMQKTVAYKFIGNGTDFLDRVQLNLVATLHPELTLRAFEDYYRRTYRDSIYVYPNGDTIMAQYPDSVFMPKGRARYTVSIREGQYDGGMYYKAACIYFGTSEKIDPLNPNSFVFHTAVIGANKSTDTLNMYNYTVYDFTFGRDSLQGLGFRSGEKIYCCAFACTAQCGYIYYTDINTGKQVYTGFSPIHSEVKNFVLP